MLIELTQDGSNTIFIPEWNERYHSKNGALQESIYVYIQNGLLHLQKSNIQILEIGFGTGLNVLLSLLYQKFDTQIIYTTLEPYPIPKSLYKQLNYTHLKNLHSLHQVFLTIHECKPAEWIGIRDNFQFIKHLIKVQDFETTQKYDLVYWDAFGPRVQPEMWSFELCKKIHHLLNPGGLIVTYCSQGQFKRNLKEAGFKVEVLPGPPFKREMTRASK